MDIEQLRRAPGPGLWIGVATVCLAMVGASCSGGDSGKASSSAPTTVPRSGPAADMSAELTGGNGVFIGQATTTDLPAVGYVEHEYVAAGTATSYKANGALSGDGHWNFVPDAAAPYKTRVVVRQPADPAKLSGTVIVEWLNVSGGVDADPEWTNMHEEIVRAGDVWVGVSTQQIGVSGGPVLVKVDVAGASAAGKGLRALDPARYGSLEHPGDAFAFDIYTQVARALRSTPPAAGAAPKRVLAAGESQSAAALVTYYNGVQPLTHAFDGFLVHSRGGGSLPLVAPGKAADMASSIGAAPTTFRTDQTAPVLNAQTETDVVSVLNSYVARQPDSDRFRLWEVTGTAHADAHLLGPTAASIDCGAPINNGPMHIVAKAALRALKTWVETGRAPATAPPIEVIAGAIPQIHRDADGIALGGVRTPPVDVPVVTLSGAPGPATSIICLLLGSTKPISAERLAQLYPSRAEYVRRYEAKADATIRDGFALPEDRAALLAFADPSKVTG